MLTNVLGGNLFGFNLYIWHTLYNVSFCNVFINYADFYPLVQYSVSGSWFLASLLLSNPRFTLTLHYCCLADSAVSSISPPPHCNVPPAAILVPPVDLQYHDFLPQPILTNLALLLSECHRCLTTPTFSSKTAVRRSLHHHRGASASVRSQIAPRGARLTGSGGSMWVGSYSK